MMSRITNFSVQTSARLLELRRPLPRGLLNTKTTPFHPIRHSLKGMQTQVSAEFGHSVTSVQAEAT